MEHHLAFEEKYTLSGDLCLKFRAIQPPSISSIYQPNQEYSRWSMAPLWCSYSIRYSSWWFQPIWKILVKLDTLPETNIAMENQPFWWYLPGKMGIFMGYVSFAEGNFPK